MTAHDLPAVLLLADGAPEAPGWRPGDYEKLLYTDAPGSAVLRLGVVALNGDTLVGFAAAAWLPLETAAEIESMVVDAGHRRRGAGAALLRACLDWAATAGATAARLEVRASNHAAIAMYSKAGFLTAATRRAYYTAPVEDALILVLILVAPLLTAGPL